jgi:ferredoxin
MPKLAIQGVGEFDVPEGKRLVRAIEDSGVNILHRCGGYAKCTTCWVEFLDGEPKMRTVAERDKLKERGESGVHLSYQCLVEQDMHVRVIHTLQSTNLEDPGATPEDQITPEPEWIPLEKE